MAWISIAPSYGKPPEWLATSSAGPSVGTFSIPIRRTRKYFASEELEDGRRFVDEALLVAEVWTLVEGDQIRA